MQYCASFREWKTSLHIPKMSQIELWLQSSGLEQYIPNFLESGITPQQFVQIGIQDYNRFGVQSLQDKQKLFKLCSALKAQA